MTQPTNRVQPWEVWWAQLNPQVGTEQAGDRPVIVVGSQFACNLPNGLAVLVPCTNTDRDLPFQPSVTLAGSSSFAMCDQVKALSLIRLRARHPQGLLGLSERPAISRALRLLLV